MSEEKKSTWTVWSRCYHYNGLSRRWSFWLLNSWTGSVMAEFSGEKVWMTMIRWIDVCVEVMICCLVVAVNIKKWTECVRRGKKRLDEVNSFLTLHKYLGGLIGGCIYIYSYVSFFLIFFVCFYLSIYLEIYILSIDPILFTNLCKNTPHIFFQPSP
jgi:hypothetical protein